jgi:hypothetical protein
MESNQELTEDKALFTYSLQDKCIDSRLKKLLGINDKSWNELKTKGIIPIGGTYQEMLVPVFRHYKEKQEVALERVKLNSDKEEKKRNYRNSESESGLPKIQEAAIIQKIKLDKAREEQVHIANIRERGSILDKARLFELIAPIVSNIASVLRNAGEGEPALQPTIDKCFVSLYNLGDRLCSQADLDSERYVKSMLEKEVDLDDIVAEAELML